MMMAEFLRFSSLLREVANFRGDGPSTKKTPDDAGVFNGVDQEAFS
jgi:hypothetical protein